MTLPPQENTVQENKPTDKELNFRQLEAKYQRQLEQERTARLEAEKKAAEVQSRQQIHHEDEEEEDEPYVDHKKLNKKLARFGEQTRQTTQTEIQNAVKSALAEERKQNWVKNNPDFFSVLEHADKLLIKDPELAETILEMPEGFERQKLVYKNIKALGLHQPPAKESTIQEKIDANRRSPYYQPSGVSNAPYAAVGDFSPVGQKNAYEKMQQLKKRLGV